MPGRREGAGRATTENPVSGNVTLAADSGNRDLIHHTMLGVGGGTGKRLRHPDYPYVDFAAGGANRRNNVVTIQEALAARDAGQNHDAFITVYRFPGAYPEYVGMNGGSVKGYAGPAYADHLPFDIDREGELETARLHTMALANYLVETYELKYEQIRYFFSGNKGFHLLVPTPLLGEVVPSPHLPAAFRGMALSIAGSANVKIDTVIYDVNRLLRMPLTRHPKSGLWKVEISWAELQTGDFLAIASTPRPFRFEPGELEARDGLAELYAKHVYDVESGGPRAAERNGAVEHEVEKIALALKPAFKKGQRHNLILAFAGYAAKCSLPRETALGVADYLLDGEPDVDDPGNLARAINATYDRVHQGEDVQGYTALRTLMAEEDLATLGELLGDDVHSSVWQEPQPLPAGLPPVEPFDSLLLPTSLRRWLCDVAERMQCPLDYLAAAAMVALGTVIGRLVGIRPKRRDDWLVVPNLWGAVVGRPGIMKTPAVQEAIAPLKRLEIEALEKFEEEECEFKAEARARELVRAEKEKLDRDKVKEALKKKDDPTALAKELAGGIMVDEAPPKRRRFIVNDTSVERVGEILAENPNGVLLYRDELIGFLKGLEREGQEGARAFYLEAWNGTGRFTYDRIQRGTKDIEATIVSVLGCIQPGPLRAYLKGAADRLAGDDGLVQRFQLVVWPEVSKEWQNVDRWPDSEARRVAFETFDYLNRLTPDQVGAERDPFKPDEIPFLHFDPAAQEAFDSWRADLELRVRSGTLHPALESHLAKYRSLVPSLALIHHLAEGKTGPVGEFALEAALAWVAYLESHAIRLYGAVTGADTYPARALAERILQGDVEDGFKLRAGVYRKGWSGLASQEEAEAAVELLIELDWLREEKVVTGGRSTKRYWINPRLSERRAP